MNSFSTTQCNTVNRHFNALLYTAEWLENIATLRRLKRRAYRQKVKQSPRCQQLVLPDYIVAEKLPVTSPPNTNPT